MCEIEIKGADLMRPTRPGETREGGPIERDHDYVSDAVKHSNYRLEQDTLRSLDEHRERVRLALEEYIRQLTAASSAGYMSEAEARNANVSRIQAESAERVLWMD